MAFFDAAPMSYSGVQPKQDRKSYLSVVTKHQRKFLVIIPRDRDEGYGFTLFVRAFAPPLQARHLDGVFRRATDVTFRGTTKTG